MALLKSGATLLHNFRDFRAIRANTEELSFARLSSNEAFEPDDLVEDEESSYYLYEISKWSQTCEPLRVMGVVGILRMTNLPDQKGYETEIITDEALYSSTDPFSEILTHEQTLDEATANFTIAPSLAKEGVGPIWALIDSEIIQEVAPMKIGPISRTQDDDSYAHRIFVLPQPSAKALIKEAIESSQIILADGHHRIQRAKVELASQPAGSAIEMIAFVCAIDQASHLIRPIHRIFSVSWSNDEIESALLELKEHFTGASIDLPGPYVTLITSNTKMKLPISSSISTALSLVEERLGADESAKIEYSSDKDYAISKATAPGVIAMICPKTPIEEIVDSAINHRPLRAKSTLFYPKPLPALILKEADNQ
ncbi:unnamed protein product [Acidithrix sp. C25]|nr:unnamed protein product [Acidithrix sp. C25]